MGMHSLSSCVVFAEPLRLSNGDGRKIDLGLVGEVTEVNGEILKALCQSGVIPVISPIARSKTGGAKLNCNADTVAGRVAAAVAAEKLVVLSDTHGILKDINDPQSRISSVSETEINRMIKDDVITKGMLPKVESCLVALEGGVRKAHIIDGRIEHSLLLEIYTDKGVGTQIVK
jgi:acetylglutamate kinase